MLILDVHFVFSGTIYQEDFVKAL